jgi:hypothetical protein
MAKTEKIFIAENGVAVGENGIGVLGNSTLVVCSDGNLVTQTISGRNSAIDLTISTAGTGKVNIPSCVFTPHIGPNNSAIHCIPDVANDVFTLNSAAQTVCCKTFGQCNTWNGCIVSLTYGGTGQNLSTVSGCKLLGYNGTNSAWISTGNSLCLTTTTLDTVQDIRTTANPTFNTIIAGSTNPATYSNTGISVNSTTARTFQYSSDDWNSSENIDIASGKTYKINNTSVLSSTCLGSSVLCSSLCTVGTITSGVWNGTCIPIAHGGTGATTATNAINNLLPAQGASAGLYLTTNGSSVSWSAIGAAAQVGYTVKTSRQTSTGNSGSVYSTPYYVNGSGQLRIYIDGVRQDPSTYTEAGTSGSYVNSVTLSDNIPATSSILFEIDEYQQFDFPAENVSVTTPLTGISDSKTIFQFSRTNNIATIITSTPHGFVTGDYIVVSGISTVNSFNTSVPVRVTSFNPATNSISYANVGPNVGWTAAPFGATLYLYPNVGRVLSILNSRVNATPGTVSGIMYGNGATAPSAVTDVQLIDRLKDASNRTNWWASDSNNKNIVVGQLGWMNYGGGHTIFDASKGTFSDGTAISSNTNPDVAWAGTYPTLMGWNGSNTYGVRVDRARYAELTIDGFAVGYKGIPASSNTTLATSDAGKCLEVSTGVTIPNGVMSAGDVVSIFNSGTGNITISSGLGALYLAGTNLTGSRTLAAKGLAAIRFISSSTAVISGAGLS